MSYPGIGTTNPAHQLETTSNVTAESLEIYSDYTFFSSSAYDWARQLRLRVKTPSSTNVFVDMGLEKDSGAYFYISKPLSTAADPKDNFRIYQDGRILINRTTARDEKLQVGGDVKVTGNLNVTGTTTVSGDVDITGDLYVTSFNQEENYIVPEGMIVMWDGAVANIPPGWELVTDVSGYYLRSSTTQNSVETGGAETFTVNDIASHAHSIGTASRGSNNHTHKYLNSYVTERINVPHGHSIPTETVTTNSVNHSHSYTDYTGKESYRSDYINNSNNYGGEIFIRNTTGYESTNGYYSSHDHLMNHNIGISGTHDHNMTVQIDNTVSSHVHTVAANGSVNTINSPLTPAYRQVILIKKLPYL